MTWWDQLLMTLTLIGTIMLAILTCRFIDTNHNISAIIHGVLFCLCANVFILQLHRYIGRRDS